MKERKAAERCVRLIFDRLNDHFGALRWWPAETPFEVIVGAILTQNTSWHNVTLAMGKLRDAGILSHAGINGADVDTLASLIKSSGYHHVKSRRLKAFTDFLQRECGGDIRELFKGETAAIRKKLLNVHGIGEETADSILLYAGGKPVFVVDAYTRRILARHGLINERASYGEIQRVFTDNLPPIVPLFNQYHALLVNAGKYFCRGKRVCAGCPLEDLPF